MLVDTSVWIDHLRYGNDSLAGLLHEGAVLGHRFVAGELACGHLSNRALLLNLLGALPQAPMAGHDEALALVDVHDLAGRGLGWVDVHLLASALLAGCKVWTFDKALQSAAATLRISAVSS